MLSDRCPVCPICVSVLSVTLVHCGQTVGWIKIKLGMQVGLSPRHTVLDGDPASRPQTGTAPAPNFRPYLLQSNGWMDQGATWYRGRPRPRRLCVRWGPSPPPKKGVEPPIFGPYLLWPNGWMDQDGTRHGGRPQPSQLCVRRGPSALYPKRGWSPLPNFRPMSISAKRLHGSRCHLVRR